MATTTAQSSASTAPPPPSAPTDASTAAATPTGAYPLSLNNLSSLVSYHANPAGLSIRSLVSLPAGSVLTPITTATPAPIKRWSTVQTSANTHIELNSALLYMNHSCAPSVEVDTNDMVVRVARNKDLREGDELSFFYPSTEWAFDNQFQCLCKAEGCLGDVKGAQFLSEEEFGKRWANPHIVALKEEQLKQKA